MKKLKVLASLVNNENEYQREQARAVTQMAERLSIEGTIIFADGDAINQSQQLLDAIQSPPEARPDAIICHPVAQHRTISSRAYSSVTWN